MNIEGVPRVTDTTIFYLRASYTSVFYWLKKKSWAVHLQLVYFTKYTLYINKKFTVIKLLVRTARISYIKDF